MEEIARQAKQRAARRAEIAYSIAEMEAGIARLKEEAQKVRSEDTPIGSRPELLEEPYKVILELVKAGVPVEVVEQIVRGATQLNLFPSREYCPYCGKKIE